MKKLPLQKAFQAYFHNTIQFDDFLNLNINDNYTEVFISKNTFSPSKELKKIQRFLNHFIIDFMEINKNVAFSYREGKSIYDAVYPHKDNKYFFTIDIKSFFTSITREIVKEIVEKNISKYAIQEDSFNQYKERIIDLLTFNNMLPIGSPCSPKLSNAIMYYLDNKIEDYCKKQKIIFTRYSDDFIFSQSDDINMFSQIKEEVQALLNEKNIKLNDKKEKIQRQGSSSKIKILGLVITPSGHITLDKKIKFNLEIVLHFYISDKNKYKNLLAEKFDNNVNKIYGIISYINEIDKNYILKLRKKYGNFVVDSFFHRDING